MSDNKTAKNLMDAFAGESQASMKYNAFAAAAEKEGFTGVARLFRAAAEAERIHAWAHLRNADKIGNVEENLKAAIEGETFEFTKMYPAMIAEAQTEGQSVPARWFEYASAVEEGHAALYKKALENPKAFDNTEIYICSVCGYTTEKEPTEKCPVCNSAAKVFHKVN